MAKVTVDLPVTGMTCAACSSRIEKVLNKQEDVEASVNLTMERATVTYDQEKVTTEAIIQKIEKLGFSVDQESLEFDIEGMTCAACSARIEKVLGKTTGVEQVSVNLAMERGQVTYIPGLVDEQDLFDKVKKSALKPRRLKEMKTVNGIKKTNSLRNRNFCLSFPFCFRFRYL